MGLLAALPDEQVKGHLRRHDFSRWFADVFRDSPLATHLHAVEGRLETEDTHDIAADIAQAIRARYETASPIGSTAATAEVSLSAE